MSLSIAVKPVFEFVNGNFLNISDVLGLIHIVDNFGC